VGLRRSAIVNHFYIYAIDSDFGSFFIKSAPTSLSNAKVCINGNEWAKRQAAKADVGFTALDNGFYFETGEPASSPPAKMSGCSASS
jgi:hypothetical protein